MKKMVNKIYEQKITKKTIVQLQLMLLNMINKQQVDHSNIFQIIKLQLKENPRAEICLASLRDWGLIVICEDLESCLGLSNHFAPEHLELLVENPHEMVQKANNAGAIFIGHWTPEAVGDYLAGPNHTLPTSGTARFSGALGVETFMKNTSIIQFTKQDLEHTKNDVIELANSEGLHSHSNSIKVRLSKPSSID